MPDGALELFLNAVDELLLHLGFDVEGADALRLFETNPSKFVDLVRGKSPESVEEVFGPGSYDIAKELSRDVYSQLRGAARVTEAGIKAKEQAKVGREALRELLQQNASTFKIPWGLSYQAAATNKALDILERKLGTRVMNVLTESAKTPGGMKNLLDKIPATERNAILEALSDPAKLGLIPKGAKGAAINALRPEDESQNALAR